MRPKGMLMMADGGAGSGGVMPEQKPALEPAAAVLEMSSRPTKTIDPPLGNSAEVQPEWAKAMGQALLESIREVQNPSDRMPASKATTKDGNKIVGDLPDGRPDFSSQREWNARVAEQLGNRAQAAEFRHVKEETGVWAWCKELWGTPMTIGRTGILIAGGAVVTVATDYICAQYDAWQPLKIFTPASEALKPSRK